jgi:hypothetical protein
MVSVPEPQQYHDDWDAWNEYFKVYCSMTHQKIVIKEGKNWQWRIDNILKSQLYQDLVEEGAADDFPFPPESFDMFQRLYVCTHGGNKPRQPRTKNGSRFRRHLRYFGCPFRFLVQVVQLADETWCLEVKLGTFEHNHPVTRDVFRTYPDERGVVTDVVGKCP